MPKVDLDTLLSRIPSPIFSDDWTEEMEDDLRRAVNRDPFLVYIKALNPHSRVWSLWRKCCHIRKTFPTDIIGPTHYTNYGLNATAKGRRRPDPDWSQTFCMKLDRLVFGSPCNSNTKLLALFIRYAVACRTDRRRVPMHDSATGHRFFDVMKEQIELANGRLNLRAIGTKARQEWVSRGLVKSWEMQVLKKLEYTLLKVVDGDEEDDAEDGLAPYRVHSVDLDNLLNAFETVSDEGLPLFTNIDIRYKSMCLSRGHGGAPKDITEYTRLHRALMLKDMRLEEHRRLNIGSIEDRQDLDSDDQLSNNAHDADDDRDYFDHGIFYDGEGNNYDDFDQEVDDWRFDSMEIDNQVDGPSYQDEQPPNDLSSF
ncbi:hypothetical protein F5Y03DRAFT_338624 [Xylaria venustula]|nr:hypothetical protein F5Y03DRAFT_338624 [Xylaria venustula]